MNGLSLRVARAEEADEQFLWRMLIEAASWRGDGPPLALADAAGNPHQARYVQGWGRTGDAGYIAERAGVPVGGAWWRLFTEDDHGYGFIEPAIPELTVGVAGRSRGLGVGTALLNALIARASRDKLPALSLSVEFDNPALRLYERLGFARTARVGGAWTMRRALRRSRAL